MKKKVWVASGSEDGIIGVFTNRRSALEEAFNYVHNSSDNGAVYDWYDETKKDLMNSTKSVKKAINVLGQKGAINVTAEDTSINADVTWWNLKASS